MRLLATRESLSECVHTALRKLCDSKQSSLLWNIIALKCNDFNREREGDVWTNYLDNLWKLLKLVDNESFTTSEALVLAATELGYGNYEVNIFSLAVECLSDQDLYGMAGYLYE